MQPRLPFIPGHFSFSIAACLPCIPVHRHMNSRLQDGLFYHQFDQHFPGCQYFLHGIGFSVKKRQEQKRGAYTGEKTALWQERQELKPCSRLQTRKKGGAEHNDYSSSSSGTANKNIRQDSSAFSLNSLICGGETSRISAWSDRHKKNEPREEGKMEETIYAAASGISPAPPLDISDSG